jgi:hypothetical protein
MQGTHTYPVQYGRTIVLGDEVSELYFSSRCEALLTGSRVTQQFFG